MTGFLLDTNVVSEMTRSRPSPLVVAFLDRTSELWLASPGSSRTGVRVASIAAGTASGSVENGPVTFSSGVMRTASFP